LFQYFRTIQYGIKDAYMLYTSILSSLQ